MKPRRRCPASQRRQRRSVNSIQDVLCQVRALSPDLKPGLTILMKILNEGIVRFLHNQHFAIVTTIDNKGCPHNSCKGIVNIDKEKGEIYLLDVYKGKTLENLKQNQHINITAVDEHRFMGFCLKGSARIAKRGKMRRHIIKSWQEKITKRISHRLLRNIRGEKGHPKHPEALLPKPEYLIVVKVKEIVDLTPHHIKEHK